MIGTGTTISDPSVEIVLPVPSILLVL